MGNLFKVLVLFFILFSVPACGGETEDKQPSTTSFGKIFIIEMSLADFGDLCIDVSVKTTKDFEGYIERWGMVYRGEGILPRFRVISPAGKAYKYTGSPDTRKMAEDADFIHVSSDNVYVEQLCLGNDFEITGDVGIIEFHGSESLEKRDAAGLIVKNHDMDLMEWHEINLRVK